MSTWRWRQQDHRLAWKIAAPQHGMTRCSRLLWRSVRFQNFDLIFPKSARPYLGKPARSKNPGRVFQNLLTGFFLVVHNRRTFFNE
jgi:hypothetical protein